METVGFVVERTLGENALVDGSIVAAALTLAVRLLSTGHQNKQERSRLLQSLVGELNSLQIHYDFTNHELERAQSDDERRMRVRWGVVGAIRFNTSEQLQRLSLTPQQISMVMQLLLLLRNNDAYAEALLASDLGRSNEFLSVDGLRGRMVNAIGEIQDVLDSIENRKPDVAQARRPLPFSKVAKAH